MPRAVALLFAALAAAACSAAPRAAVAPSNHAPATAGTRSEHAVALLHALSDALRHDQPLGPLLDPKDGAWIWDQPGAAVMPSEHVDAGDRRRPSEIIAASGWPEGAQKGWAITVADAIDHGLGVLDSDPDLARPVYYTDCGDEKMPPPARAFLRTKDIDLDRDEPGVLDSPAAAATTPLGFHFQYGTVAIYLSERDGQLAVAHLLRWYACDA